MTAKKKNQYNLVYLHNRNKTKYKRSEIKCLRLVIDKNHTYLEL